MPVDLLRYKAKKYAHRFGAGSSQLPRPGTLGPRRHGPVDLDFVLIGAQKAGSTFLHQALQHHPDLTMPIGEVPVFQEPEYSRDGIGWLDVLFADAVEGTLRGIKRPDYLGRPESPRYLAHHAPNTKLIAVLREPVTRAISAYYHYMRQGHIPVRLPEEGFATLLAGEYDDRWPRAWEVLGFSQYGLGLQRYRDLFPREQLQILVQEEVLMDPASALGDVYRFLGVEESFQAPGLEVRELPTVYALERVRYLSWARSLRSEFDAAGQRSIHRKGLAGKLGYAAAMGVDRLILEPILGNDRPILGGEVLQRLYALFAEDRVVLERVMGRGVEAWRE